MSNPRYRSIVSRGCNLLMDRSQLTASRHQHDSNTLSTELTAPPYIQTTIHYLGHSLFALSNPVDATNHNNNRQYLSRHQKFLSSQYVLSRGTSASDALVTVLNTTQHCQYRRNAANHTLSSRQSSPLGRRRSTTRGGRRGEPRGETDRRLSPGLALRLHP